MRQSGQGGDEAQPGPRLPIGDGDLRASPGPVFPLPLPLPGPHRGGPHRGPGGHPLNQPDPTTPDPVAYFKAWLAYQTQENQETREPPTSFSAKHPSLNNPKTPL